jgi:hypothetical protein
MPVSKILLLSLSCCTQSKPERQQELNHIDQLSFSPQQHLQALQQLTDKRYLILLSIFNLSNSFYLFKMNYSVTRFTGIDYANKSARWDLVAERHTQESALATCKSLNLNRPFYHRVEVNSKRVELPRFTVIKPNMKSDYAPIVIPASFTVRKKLNIFQRIIRRFF